MLNIVCKVGVNLTAEKEAKVKGSTVVAGRDISITGAGVAIENSDSIYNAQEKHEFERTGISVSVGGDIIDVANAVVQPLEKAVKAQDKRLAALEVVKAGKEAQKYLDAKDNIAHLEQEAANAGKLLDAAKADNAAGGVIKNLEANKALQDARLENAKNKKNGGSNDFNISVSVGTTKSRSESSSTTTVANASEIKAGGDVSIIAAKKDISIAGSSVSGENVKLDARENLNISASKNTNKTEESSKSSSASIGATISSAGTSYNVSGSMSRGEVSANGTTYNESTITANKDLSFVSGKDTNIKGGMLKGEKVTGSIGNDLNIESKKDSNSYKESSKSAGASIGIGSGSVSGGVNSSKIKSNYESVTDQSGIYAGSEGFDIGVGKNTDLKGGIISGKAEVEKNTISTGTLTFEDIENKADYKADNNSITVSQVYGNYKYSPSKGMPASGKEESKTKATISEGTIEIRDKENQKQDVSKLNRDTNNSLNKLGEIFDRTAVKDRMALADEFGKLAYKAVGDLAQAKGWKDGSKEKNALHVVVGGIMSKLGENGFLEGASAGLINEMVQKELAEMFKDPGMHELASALLGEVASELVGGNAGVGASVANSATKNNYLTHEQLKKMKIELAAAKTESEKEAIRQKYIEISRAQTELGITGEGKGFGYEYGYDPELPNNALNIIPDDVNASNSLRQVLTAFEIGKNIDVSSWKENEIKSITIGGNIKVFSGSTGYAMDSKYNMYKISIIGIGKDIDISKYTMSSIVKAITAVNVEYNSQTINGLYTAKELAEIYQGSSIGGSYSHVITIGVSGSNNELQASYGASNTFFGVLVAETTVEYIGNAKEGL